MSLFKRFVWPLVVAIVGGWLIFLWLIVTAREDLWLLRVMGSFLLLWVIVRRIKRS